MLRRFLPLLGLALAGPAAAAEEPAPAWSAGADFAYVTRYTYRGIKLGGAAWEPSVTVGAGPWSLNAWANYPLAREEAIERDYSLTYSAEAAGCSWKVVAQYWGYPQAEAPDTTHTFEAGLGVSRDFEVRTGVALTGGLAAYYDLRLDSTTVEASLGHTRTVRLLGREAELTLTATAGHVASYDQTPDAPPPKSADGYSYATLRAELAFTLNEHSSLQLAVAWDGARNLNTGGEDLAGNLVGGATLSVSW